MAAHAIHHASVILLCARQIPEPFCILADRHFIGLGKRVVCIPLFIGVTWQEREHRDLTTPNDLMGKATHPRTLYVSYVDNLPSPIVLLGCCPLRCCVAELAPRFTLRGRHAPCGHRASFLFR